MDHKVVDRFPSGIITMPPSKSVSHRAVICACLAEGESVIDNIDMSQDIEATARCMRGLGARVGVEGRMLRVNGGLTIMEAALDCGESGSTLRFLIPVAALGQEMVTFTGKGRLMERPMTPYTLGLAAHGAVVTQKDGTVAAKGPLRPGTYALPGDVSSQFVTGLLLTLPLLRGDSDIVLTTPLESAAYVDITVEVMERFGVSVQKRGYNAFHIKGGQRYTPQRYAVEGDYSQAAYFLAAGALGRTCQCRGLSPHSKQGDAIILDILRRSGARVETTPEGGMIVTAGALKPQDVDVSNAPDLAPPLAALFSLIPGTSNITGAKRLRIKESDRLHALATELSKLGAHIEEGEDSLIIHGVESLEGGRVTSWNDHRIAMALALAAIRCAQPVEIDGYECVAKSYPRFFEDFCAMEGL